ncbi:hypothetical protein OIU35_31425 [Boseaceae bacterium BT-24-1]|nr:hypothetical protein [Boseaceae bacterium BT-24-1]
MTAPLPPTTASDAELVASKLRARAESFGRLHGNYLYYGAGDSLTDKEAAVLIDKLSAEVAALHVRFGQLHAAKDIHAEMRHAAETEAAGLRKAAKCALGHLTGNMDGDMDLGDPVEMLRAALTPRMETSDVT